MLSTRPSDPLPRMPEEDIVKAPEVLRQSSIARFDNCPQSLRLEQLEPKPRQVGNMAARGTLFHSWVARALALMRREGETQFAVEQGMELLMDVLAQRDIPDE